MKTRGFFTILLLLAVNFAHGQEGYSSFTFLIYDKDNTCTDRLFEMLDMLKHRNFLKLEYIAPNINNINYEALEQLSDSLNLYHKIGLGDYGTAEVACNDCETVQFSYLIYKRNGTSVDDLKALTISVQSQLPFYIDTIIISDTLYLPEQIRNDIHSGDLRGYPPVDPSYPQFSSPGELEQKIAKNPREHFALYGCFGSLNNFEVTFDQNNNPYLKGSTIGCQENGEFILGSPEVIAAEKMNLPIRLYIGCISADRVKQNPTDVSTFADITNVVEVDFVYCNFSEISAFLIANEKIEKLGFCFNNASPPVVRFNIPDEIIQMRSLREINFYHRGKTVVVSIPSFMEVEDSKIAIHAGEDTDVLFYKRE